jgi:hypothetical protein
VTWSSSGTGDTEVHYTPISGIKLDKTAPTGSITPSVSVTETSTITLNLNKADAASGVAQMRLANENGVWTEWIPYSAVETWTLSDGIGVKTVYCQFMDNAGLTSPVYSCTVTVQTPESTPSAFVSEPTATPTVMSSPTVQPSPTPDIPELQSWMVLLLLATSAALLLALSLKKRNLLKT